MQEIYRLTRFANEYEEDFVKAIIGHSMQALQTDRAIKEKTLKDLLARDKELDGLFEKIYEDNASGKITEQEQLIRAVASCNERDKRLFMDIAWAFVRSANDGENQK